jgi:hypothetical protein
MKLIACRFGMTLVETSNKQDDGDCCCYYRSTMALASFVLLADKYGAIPIARVTCKTCSSGPHVLQFCRTVVYVTGSLAVRSFLDFFSPPKNVRLAKKPSFVRSSFIKNNVTLVIHELVVSGVCPPLLTNSEILLPYSSTDCSATLAIHEVQPNGKDLHFLLREEEPLATTPHVIPLVPCAERLHDDGTVDDCIVTRQVRTLKTHHHEVLCRSCCSCWFFFRLCGPKGV